MTAGDDLLAEIERDLVSGAPIADTLRKCVLLGGRAGSVDLREWATRELKGYESVDDLPTFRKVGAVILIDAVTGSTRVTGQRVGAEDLPEFAREYIKEEVALTKGVGEIEEMLQQARDGGIKLPIPARPVAPGRGDIPRKRLVPLETAAPQSPRKPRSRVSGTSAVSAGRSRALAR